MNFRTLHRVKFVFYIWMIKKEYFKAYRIVKNARI